MSVRRNDDDHCGSKKKDEPNRQDDPVNVFGLIYRAITDSTVLTRLCVLLLVAAGLLVGVAVLAPPDVLAAMVSLLSLVRG